jgi:hypothetical protein
MPGVDYPGFEVDNDTVIWRYMPAARFGDLLAGHLYFAAARQFDDQFEGAITEAENARREQIAARTFPDDTRAQRFQLQELSRAFADLRRMTKMSCWHARRHENVAMWERYRPATGCGVAIASTVGSLKRSLHEFRLKPSYGSERIVVGGVRYIDYANEEMTDGSMLGIFLHKRIEYQDEQEVRALLSLRMASEYGVEIPDDGVTVSVDAGELIDEVRVCPDATRTDVEELEMALRQANLDCSVSRSTLGRGPTY